MTEAEGSFRERRSAHAAAGEEPGSPPGEPERGPEAPEEPAQGREPSLERPAAGERREPGPIGSRNAPPLPEGPFFDVVQYVVLRASQCLGEIPFDETGEKRLLPREAKAYIDLLSVLRERTREDLSTEAANALESVLSDLRMRYLELA